MSFYEDRVLPHVLNCACGTGPVTRQREKVVPQAAGTVLEIGIGTGLNLGHYQAEKIDRLIGIDPAENAWKLAAKPLADIEFPVEFVGLPGEEIPLDDHSVDCIVMTYSLCTIPDPIKALQGMGRVLKPEGKLYFAEHAKAPDESVRRWQNRLNGIWGKIAGGCHLNRDIPQLLVEGGFESTDLQSMYLPGTPRFAGFNVWGSASWTH